MGERQLSLWRLYDTGGADGAWNMAIDEALLETVPDEGPFLRFYTWNPGTLSLGRFQHPETGLTEAAHRVPRVRRPTGGGGIWHENELTYSLGCSRDALAGGVKASFEHLCGFLLATWQSLGWDAHFAKDLPERSEALGAYTPACFAGQEEYDIVVDGRKLGGNAQRRDRGTVFQHGSIPIRLDHDRLSQLFLPEFRPHPQATTDLASCGWGEDSDQLVQALAVSFERRIARLTAPQVVAEPVAARAAALVKERYGNPDWTESGGGNLRG